MPTNEPYRGFEQGPIRPPSEARSLLVRITRGCDWNRCTFCPVYKGEPSSVRPVEHVVRDVDAVNGFVEELRAPDDPGGPPDRQRLQRLRAGTRGSDAAALAAAWGWILSGGSCVFLQDANALAAGPEAVERILAHLRRRFPEIERVTTYARSSTLARLDAAELAGLRQAGLSRIHVGFETGLNALLAEVKKGASKELHVAAGRAVKAAGIELSEYTMPGLGGRARSREHALESADALNRIDPDFIRLRTLAIAPSSPLADEVRAGRFVKCTDVEIVAETLVFLEALDGIASQVTSDHILNLFEDLEGRLPDDRERMLGILRAFLELPPARRSRYQLGRRLGLLRNLADLDSPRRMARVEAAFAELGLRPDEAGDVDALTDRIMTRFV